VRARAALVLAGLVLVEQVPLAEVVELAQVQAVRVLAARVLPAVRELLEQAEKLVLKLLVLKLVELVRPASVPSK